MKKNSFNRGAGILMPISSLPSQYGIGTFGKEARAFADTLEEIGQKYWQVLPLGPTSYGDSPYQSFSAMAGNPYFIDLEKLTEENLLQKNEIDEIFWGMNLGDIDYANLYERRFPILRKAFERFDTKGKEFLLFCEEEKEWLSDYALYMAVKAYFGQREWLSWDEDIRERKEKAVQAYQEKLKDDILFYEFLQFEFHKQWMELKLYANQKGIEIIGDIPLYVALDSADVWAHRTEFQLDEKGYPVNVAGCPPDAFSDDGQKWGNPLYDWEKMEKEDFWWWKLRMKSNAKNYDVIRIDHFIGVVRYFSIPAKDENARKGKWRPGPGKKLTDAISEAIGDRKIIAEDLGVSVPGVKTLLKRAGWPGMKILLFAFDGNPAHEYLPHNYDSTQMVVYGGTHDNETLAGFFYDKTEKELEFLYRYLEIDSKKEIVDALIRLGYSSIADVVIFQMQDILKLGNEARMNLPSTIGTNWRWRMKKDEFTEERKEFLKNLTQMYNR